MSRTGSLRPAASVFDLIAAVSGKFTVSRSATHGASAPDSLRSLRESACGGPNGASFRTYPPALACLDCSVQMVASLMVNGFVALGRKMNLGCAVPTTPTGRLRRSTDLWPFRRARRRMWTQPLPPLEELSGVNEKAAPDRPDATEAGHNRPWPHLQPRRLEGMLIEPPDCRKRWRLEKPPGGREKGTVRPTATAADLRLGVVSGRYRLADRSPVLLQQELNVLNRTEQSGGRRFAPAQGGRPGGEP